jgi:hypothetical protein
MSNEPHPDWNLLPHNPVAFFELGTDFDRKSLKRKYSALIKLFKPERAPDEFQRIRAAFEMLDAGLRYGQQQLSVPAIRDYQWQTDALQSNKAGPINSTAAQTTSNETGSLTDRTSPSAVPTAIPVYQRLQQEPIANVYRELSAKSAKQPFDYFALALISDLVTPRDKSMFLKWLLTGLKEFPEDPGLFSMLYEYFHEDVSAELASAALLATSQIITNDRFYYLTEKLWDQLLRAGDFKRFQTTLQRCEKNLKDFRISARLAFYIHILRSAIWKGDQQWLESRFQFLEENSQEIPRNLEWDLDLLFLLRDYRQGAKSNSKDPIRKKIDAAIVNYFTLDEREGDAAIIRLQTILGQDAAALLKSFPLANSPNDADADPVWKLVNIWEWINDDICLRHDLTEPTNTKSLADKTLQTMIDLDKSEPFTMREFVQYQVLNFGPYIAAFIMPFVILWQWLDSWVLFVTLLLAIALPIVVHLFLNPAKLWSRKVRQSARRRYLRTWRERFVQLLDATHASHHELAQAMYLVVASSGTNLGFPSHSVNLLPIDPGLAFYAWTTRYAR